MAGKAAEICYVEIPAPDMEKARAFYSAVFGWKIEKTSERYMMFETSEEGLSGGFSAEYPASVTGPVLYLQVADINGVLQAINENGGSTMTPKKSIGEWGFYAWFKDPNGNRVGLWSRS